MELAEVVRTAIEPAAALLPPHLDTPRARVMLLAIGLQESGFTHRRQIGDGPARGFWQFEKWGGVLGVYRHHASTERMRTLCRARDVSFEPRAIWAMLEHDDVLAAGAARLLLVTDPAPLPEIGHDAEAWTYYLRTWRPGKPRLEHWRASYDGAVSYLRGISSEADSP